MSETPNVSTDAMPPDRRGPGRPRDARAHASILQATLDLLVESGYAGVTLEKVARRAGVGKTTIYRWWDSKLDLVLEAAAPHLDIGAVPNTGDTRRDLEIGLEQIIRTYSDQIAAIVIFVVIADLEQDERLRTVFRSTWVLPWRTSFAEALKRGVARGDLPEDLDVQFAIDLVSGTVFQRVLIVPTPMTDGLADALIDLLFHGPLPRTAEPG